MSSKPTKTKKDKVPKITEAEYAAYVSSLRALAEGVNSTLNEDMGTSSCVKTGDKEQKDWENGDMRLKAEMGFKAYIFYIYKKTFIKCL